MHQINIYTTKMRVFEYLFSYIKHVDVLIHQRLWFNSLDFKRLRSKNSVIVILCGNVLTFIMLKSVFSYVNTRYIIFSLQFLHMIVAIKERTFLNSLIWLSDTRFFDWFWFLSIFWIDWMIFIKCYLWILLNNYSFQWFIFLSIFKIVTSLIRVFKIYKFKEYLQNHFRNQ